MFLDKGLRALGLSVFSVTLHEPSIRIGPEPPPRARLAAALLPALCQLLRGLLPVLGGASGFAGLTPVWFPFCALPVPGGASGFPVWFSFCALPKSRVGRPVCGTHACLVFLLSPVLLVTRV